MERKWCVILIATLLIFTGSALATETAYLSTSRASVVGGPGQKIVITATIPVNNAISETGDDNEAATAVKVQAISSTCEGKCLTLSSSSALCKLPVLQYTTYDSSTRQSTTVDYTINLKSVDGVGWVGKVEVPCEAVARSKQIDLTLAGTTGRTSLVVEPLMKTVVARTQSVSSGGQGTGRVVFNEPWPTAVEVQLTSLDSTVLSTPPSVTMPAGHVRVDFPVQAGQVSSNTTVDVRAVCTASGVQHIRKASFVVVP